MIELLVERLGIERISINGPTNKADRLPSTLSVAILGTTASDLIRKLKGQVAISAGSDCHGDSVSISPILSAIGLDRNGALSTLRISFSPLTSMREVEEGAQLIADQVALSKF